MSGHPADLATRRRNLQLKAAAQRQQLAENVGDIEQRFLGVDRAYLTIRRWLRRPVLLGGGAALLLFLGWRAMRRGGRATLLVPIARRLLRQVLKLFRT